MPSDSSPSDSLPPDPLPESAVAVIGLACRFPGAATAEEFWRLLAEGREGITFFSPEQLEAAGIDRQLAGQPGFVAAKGVLEEADAFDTAFFGFSPREAALMDPQQRVFLECAWAALEDAGHAGKDSGGAVGVFAGSILSTYLLGNLWPNRRLADSVGTFQLALGNDVSFLATRTSYLLDLKGPSVSVATACSTSLVAVHLACQSLLSHECDTALAGGVSVHLPLVAGYRFEEGSILSPDGHCRPFDVDAQGTVSSDGVGVVVLKRLEDAVADGDFISAVILGSAINNDGSAKVGFTAPGVAGQARVIAEALAMAGVEPGSVSMVEAHAAGTRLGDPIEVAALKEVFDGCGADTCALGSVKSNIGHVDAAAGVAGLIKTVLALRQREIPPSLHFTALNPRIDFSRTPFHVPTGLKPFRGDGPMRAGVSAFGIGGTNAHVVLEEPPRLPNTQPLRPRPFELLLLSARTATALDTATDRLADHLERRPDIRLGDVGHTLRAGRRGFGHRRFVVAADGGQAADMLRARDSRQAPAAVAPSDRATVGFMFPGIGDQYPGMGWELYCTESQYRRTVDDCAGLLRPHLDGDIRDHLFPGRDWSRPELGTVAATGTDGGGKIDLRAMLGRREAGQAAPAPDLPTLGQPAIFVTEYALARLLRSWGIEPDAMIGYSIGEFAAACVAGVVSLADAVEIVATRARLIETHVARGAMLAVPVGEAELRGFLPAGVSVAAVNGARLTVASGEEHGVADLESRLAAAGVSCQRLRSTHAYHSDMLGTIVGALSDALARIELKPPQIPYVSCVTGTWITDGEATSPGYWAQHLCRTVRFQEGLSRLLDAPGRVLLEVGPGQSLTSHALAEKARIKTRQNPVVPTMRWSYGTQSELAVLLRGIGQLWLAGAPMDMTRLLARGGERRVPLPTYPFERERYWIDPPVPGQGEGEAAALRRPSVDDWFFLPCWKPSAPVWSAADGGSPGDWLLFIDGLGVGAELADRLRRQGERVATVTAGAGFQCIGDAFTLDPASEDDYRSLARILRDRNRLPRAVAHLWCLTGASEPVPSAARCAAVQEKGFHSLMRLFQALWSAGQSGALQVEIVADGLFDVHGGEALAPEKATLLGPAMVVPQERADVVCRCLDIDIPPGDISRRGELLDLLLTEFCSKATGPAVAYRRGRRMVQGYEQVTLDPAWARTPFRQRGVYLLTGGLGGIGLVMARHLARTVQARLVLVGRTALPERESWARWLADHDSSDRTSARIAEIMALEEMGAEVLVIGADVFDRAAMERVLALTDARFGELHGVIHGAGAIGMETFREVVQATTADSEAQFKSKVHGLLVLDQVLAGRTLDFCVLMSSLAAILGGLGFAAYSAANQFMDAFARSKNRAGGTRWTSIDWDSWRLPGANLAIAGLGATVNEFYMEADEGMAAFERAVTNGTLDQVVVSTGDIGRRLRQWVTRDAAAAPAAAMTIHRRPELGSAFKAPNGQLELDLAEIWKELFNIDPIGVDDNFFELGGHSLLATQLTARISSRLHVDLSLATLLQAPTIAELSLAILAAQAAQADPETLERMLAEVGDMSPEELERLLSEETDTLAMAGDDE